MALSENQEMVKRLYDDYADVVYHFLLKLSGSEEIAVELLQDTFSRAVQYFKKDTEYTNHRSWLFKIAHNQFKNFLREKYKLKSNVDLDSARHIAANENGYNEIDTKALKENIILSLRNKKPIFAEIFILKVDHQFSYLEIGNSLDISEKTVRRHYEKIKTYILNNFSKDFGI